MISPTVSNNSVDYIYVPVVLILLVAIWVMMRGRDDIQYDSNTFKDALQIWLPLAAQRRETPRAIKRFVNRTRYFAMRLRDERNASNSDPDSEATIVALSAIHQIDPDVISKPAEQIVDSLTVGLATNDDFDDDALQEIRHALYLANSQHDDTFATHLTEEVKHTLPLFREISKGIQVK